MSQPLSLEAQQIWDNKADWWDALMGDEGNEFHRVVVGPPLEQLLRLRPGETVLDIGCGNGHVARRLARLGGVVTATDSSPRFLELARKRSEAALEKTVHPICFARVDATDPASLGMLESGAWDAIVSTMALMDMATIEPLCHAAGRLLRPGGRFVAAVAHPCFNSSHVAHVAEERDRDGQLVVEYSLRIGAYRSSSVSQGAGAVGEPEPHYYFHRSIEELLTPALAAGLLLDGLLEPCYPPNMAASRPFAWANYPDIPPVLVFRLRHSR